MTLTIHLATVMWIIGIAAYLIAGLFIGMPLISLYSEGKVWLGRLLDANIWGLHLVVILTAWLAWIPLLILIVLIALLNPETYR